MNKENNKAKAWEKRLLKSRKKMARTLKFREFMSTWYDIIGKFHMFEINIIIMWACIIMLRAQRRRIDINNMSTLDSVSITVGIVVLILSMIVSTFFAIVLLYRIIRRMSSRKKNTENPIALDIGEGTVDMIYNRTTINDITPVEHIVMSGSGSIKKKTEQKKEIEH